MAQPRRGKAAGSRGCVRLSLACLVFLSTRALGLGQTVALPAQIVTATRAPEPAQRVAASVTAFDADTLRATPALTLDGAFRSAPAFTLFRRSDSLSANPTAQGVSLRGLGPSGASRSLVVLDGVPLNDPFGGWVAWTKIPRETLARAELVPGGGASAWGNAALGGVVQILTANPEADHLRFAVEGGDFGTRSAEASATLPVGRGSLQLLARDFATDGFSLVAPESRGPIDVPAWSRHRWLTARWRQPLGATVELTATARMYEEFRGNGTPYTRNGSREKFASVAAAGQPAANFAWTAVAYAQDQSFASTFSSVNSTRTAETPASDQFAVPATAIGAAWTGAWQHANHTRTSAGIDARFVHGETRENSTFSNGDFTRQRVAGGSQTIAGVFGLHEFALAPQLAATVGGRADMWRDDHGHRRETDRVTGAVSRDDLYPARTGTEFSPSLGAVWTPAAAWRIRANAQHAFRRPTLNELYRPFRQGANITEANAALRTERVTSGEIGVEWSVFNKPSRPNAGRMNGEKIALPAMADGPAPRLLTLSATAFRNDLRDAVGNVTLVRGPGSFPLFGTVPAGGSGRQRLNLDSIRVQGLELAAQWTPLGALAFTANFLYDDATVRRASVAPALVGKRVAQVPRRSGSLGAVWHAPLGFTFTPRVRWIGRQFEDDENELVLGEVVVVDLGVSRPLGPHLELFLNVENLGDARVETGRSANGVVNVGTPRFVIGGLRGSW